MERNKGKTSKGIILVLILLTISLSILLYFTYNEYLEYNNILKDNKGLNSKINILNKEYTKELDIKKELEDNENTLNNTEEEIIKLKEEVFSLARKLEDKITNNESNYKIAYLTFDDGPYLSTDEVLDILDKYKVKATFFTIGLDKDICYDNNNYSCAETYKKEVDRGHTIANHTYTHAIFRGLYNSTTSFISDVKRQETLIEERTGVKTNIVRFPGGSSTARGLKESIINELRNLGYGWVDWTANDGDGGYLPNTTVAWNNFTNSINENIEVVLFHDYSNITISILPKAIEYLQDNNYILLPLFYNSIKVNK